MREGQLLFRQMQRGKPPNETIWFIAFWILLLNKIAF